MNQIDKDKNNRLISLLNFMVENNAFEREAAQYLLSRIPNQILLEPQSRINTKNFIVSANFFGNILIRNTYAISKNDYSVINEWRELLLEKDPKLVNNSDFVFTGRSKKEQAPKAKDNLEIKGSFMDLYAVRNFQEWIKNPEKEVAGYTLKDLNPTIITLECICEEQDSYYSTNQSNDPTRSTSQQSTYLINTILKGKNNIIKNKWHDEQTFTNKIFHSKRMKSVMRDVDSEVLESLFSQESLGTIIKNANTFDSIRDNRELFLNLSPLASPEKWLNGWRKTQQTKTINLVEFFNNKFNYAYGLNLHLEYRNGLRKEGKEHPGVAETFKEEFKFFLPALAKMELDKNHLCLLANGILRSHDIQLMSMFLDYFDLPKVNADESPESIKIYEKMMSTMNSITNLNYEDPKSGLKAHNWHEAVALIQAAKLSHELDRKDEPVIKRSLKI